MPKVVDPEAERSVILEALFEVFAEQGFGSVRMRQLAKTAGVSIGKLYHYFPNKRALADRLFVHVGAGMITDAIATDAKGEDPRQKLAKLADFAERRSARLSGTLMLALDHRRLHSDEHVPRDSLRAYRMALTEHQDVGLISHESARERDLLPLADRELSAVLESAAQLGLMTLGHAIDEGPGHALLRCLHQTGSVMDVRHVSNADVLAHGQLIVHKVLEDDTQSLPQRFGLPDIKRSAVQADLALTGLIEPREQLDERGLAAAVVAYKGQATSWL